MVKMRVDKQTAPRCWSCGATRKNSIELFDVLVGELEFTICDKCNEELFQKTLKATCMVNGKLKSPADLKIIRSRAIRKGENE